MAPLNTHPRKPSQQSQKFIDKARELGVDEDEAAFDEKLAAIAGQKPKPKTDEASDE